MSRYVLVPGDPDRTFRIAINVWDSYWVVSKKRGLLSVRGEYDDFDIGACSSGMGPGSAGIVGNELASIGCDTFCRVGSCGSFVERVGAGHIAIIRKALRKFDGYTEPYEDVLGPDFRALADDMITERLVRAAEELGYRQGHNLHIITACTTTDFYAGQGRPLYNGLLPERAKKRIQEAKNLGASIFEMEASVLYTLAMIFGLRAGGLCGVVADRYRNQFLTTEKIHILELDLGKVASMAMKMLYEEDLRCNV